MNIYRQRTHQRRKIEQLLLQSNTRDFKTFILLNFLNLNMMGYGRKLQIISLSEKSALLLLLHTIFFNDNCNMISYILQSIHFIREKNRVDFVGFNQYYLKEGCHGFLDRYEPFSSRSRHSFVGINPVIRNENDSHI